MAAADLRSDRGFDDRNVRLLAGHFTVTDLLKVGRQS